jgi:hypothetical protein
MPTDASRDLRSAATIEIQDGARDLSDFVFIPAADTHSYI